MSNTIIAFPTPRKREYEFTYQGKSCEPLRVQGGMCQIRQKGRRPRWVALTQIERREVWL